MTRSRDAHFNGAARVDAGSSGTSPPSSPLALPNGEGVTEVFG